MLSFKSGHYVYGVIQSDWNSAVIPRDCVILSIKPSIPSVYSKLKHENYLTNHVHPKQWKIFWIIVVFSCCAATKTRKRSGSGSSRADERATMDEDWCLGRVLIPEESPTSVITISLSNTQSHHSMAPKWQKTLCNTHTTAQHPGES